MFFIFIQHFYTTFVTEGNDPTGEFEWITEEGRLRMIGLANETCCTSNETTVYVT